VVIRGLGPLPPKVTGELAKATLDAALLTGLSSWNGARDTVQVRLAELPEKRDGTFSFAQVPAAAVAQVRDVWLLCHYTVGPAGSR
jgi:hypothetical protein